MNTEPKEGIAWKTRDAWLCFVALIFCDYALLLWLRIAARSNVSTAEFLNSSIGSAVKVVLQCGLWMFLALWFSRAATLRDFLKRAGLKDGLSLSGWCVAWIALGIALIEHYGTIKGWTASSRELHPPGFDAQGSARWFFALKVILIAPVIEETVTRGYLYRAFRVSYPIPLALIVIILFSTNFHWGSISHSGFTFVCLASLWVLLCLVREFTGSLWNCLLCHAVFNAAGIFIWPVVVVGMFLLLAIGAIFKARQPRIGQPRVNQVPESVEIEESQTTNGPKWRTASDE